jgi:hypothetical protein
MNSFDVLNYAVTFLLIVASIGIIVVTVVFTGTLLLLREVLMKVRQFMMKAVYVEEQAKRGALHFVLNVLDLFSERR